MSVRRTSFFARQLLATLCVNFLSLSLVAFLLYSSFISDYKASLVNALSSQSTLLSSASRTSLLFNDASTTESLLLAASGLEPIRFARVYDSDQTLFASYTRDGVTDNTSPTELQNGATFTDHSLYLLEPIYFDEETIGYLLLAGDTRQLEQQQRNAMVVALGVLALSMLISYLLNWHLQRMLSRPLNSLINLIKKVARHRDYSLRLPDVRQDELGELFRGVNDILTTTEKHQAQLENHNTELESLVELRTEQLFQRANYDALTHLPNRHLFLDRLEQGLKLAHRNNHGIAVMFLDLDRFKLINDSLGHDIGDEVLIDVARKLKDIVRDADSICRWGGDEFIIMVEHTTQRHELIKLAERIINSLCKPMNINENRLHISTSIGIASFPEQQANAMELLKFADTSMYHAKAAGPGHYRFFDSNMMTDSINRLSMESKLRQAIQDDTFHVVYQPQFDTRTQDLRGIEALIRWEDTEGRVPPSVFIPVAEEAGFINELSCWMLNQVSRQIQQWMEAGFKLVPVAINLPACFITQPDCAEQIVCILRKYYVPPHLLEIELTENTFIKATDQVLRSLKAIKSLGVEVSLDDFGTGYSCLSYISTLPIDKLKIDGSFVAQLGQSQSNDGIVKAIIMLARSQGLVTVGECVETKEQLEKLAGMGCELIQGFYFSPPQLPADITSFFKREPHSQPHTVSG